jgi:hypothetical protein
MVRGLTWILVSSIFFVLPNKFAYSETAKPFEELPVDTSQWELELDHLEKLVSPNGSIKLNPELIEVRKEFPEKDGKKQGIDWILSEIEKLTKTTPVSSEQLIPISTLREIKASNADEQSALALFFRMQNEFLMASDKKKEAVGNKVAEELLKSLTENGLTSIAVPEELQKLFPGKSEVTVEDIKKALGETGEKKITFPHLMHLNRNLFSNLLESPQAYGENFLRSAPSIRKFLEQEMATTRPENNSAPTDLPTEIPPGAPGSTPRGQGTQGGGGSGGMPPGMGDIGGGSGGGPVVSGGNANGNSGGIGGYFINRPRRNTTPGSNGVVENDNDLHAPDFNGADILSKLNMGPTDYRKRARQVAIFGNKNGRLGLGFCQATRIAQKEDRTGRTCTQRVAYAMAGHCDEAGNGMVMRIAGLQQLLMPRTYDWISDKSSDFGIVITKPGHNVPCDDEGANETATPFCTQTAQAGNPAIIEGYMNTSKKRDDPNGLSPGLLFSDPTAARGQFGFTIASTELEDKYKRAKSRKRPGDSGSPGIAKDSVTHQPCVLVVLTQIYTKTNKITRDEYGHPHEGSLYGRVDTVPSWAKQLFPGGEIGELVGQVLAKRHDSQPPSDQIVHTDPNKDMDTGT